jgi:hypothetical protein
MDDLKKLTVKRLRELARDHLGKGYSKLTKGELMDALKRIPHALKEAVRPSQAPQRTKRAATHEPKPKTRRAVRPAARKAQPPPRTEKTPAPKNGSPQPSVRAGPVVEGFFVAKGARAAPESAADERRWEPQASGADWRADREETAATVALPVDPQTLFVFWSFSRATLDAARAGLEAPRAVLRIYEGDLLVRELPFEPSAKSFYVHGLKAGSTYRVEAFWVDGRGVAKRIGEASNAIALPAQAPSSDLTVRFLQVPPEMPVSRVEQAMKAGSLELTEWEVDEPEFLGWEQVHPSVSSAELQRPGGVKGRRPRRPREHLETPGAGPWANPAPESSAAVVQPLSRSGRPR